MTNVFSSHSVMIFAAVSIALLGFHVTSVTSNPVQNQVEGQVRNRKVSDLLTKSQSGSTESQVVAATVSGTDKNVGHSETIAGGKNGGGEGVGNEPTNINGSINRQRRWGGCGYKGLC